MSKAGISRPSTAWMDDPALLASTSLAPGRGSSGLLECITLKAVEESALRSRRLRDVAWASNGDYKFFTDAAAYIGLGIYVKVKGAHAGSSSNPTLSILANLQE